MSDNKFVYKGDEFRPLTAEEIAKLPPKRDLPIPPSSLAGQALRDGVKITRY